MNHLVKMISPSGAITTIAGSGNAGFADGVGSAASFNRPSAVAVDSYGNVYVADDLNHRIRTISPFGNVSTLAGSGAAAYTDGMGLAASFCRPFGVAIDYNGTLYVADYCNYRIRKISPSGAVTTLAGSGSQAFANGLGSEASFYDPFGVAVDSNGIVYVGDAGNNRIRRIDTSGNVTTLAGSGNAEFADGVGSAASFYSPRHVAVDSTGTVFVADFNNHRIRQITTSGNVTTFAGSSPGFLDGLALTAKFQSPYGVAVDSYGNVYVGDAGTNSIRKITRTT